MHMYIRTYTYVATCTYISAVCKYVHTYIHMYVSGCTYLRSLVGEFFNICMHIHINHDQIGCCRDGIL